MQTDVLILGGGLSGLYTAFRLTQAGVSYQLLEARDRCGGRIETRQLEGASECAGFDFGPAWIWPVFQPRIAALLDELRLRRFAQQIDGDVLYEDAHSRTAQRIAGPAPDQGSERLSGGWTQLIDALARRTRADIHHLGQRVTRIQTTVTGVQIKSRADGLGEQHWQANRVVCTLPPRLLARHIVFEPALPAEVGEAFLTTPTWMAGHAKVIAMYNAPFWREQGLSGHVFSRRGPLTEIHDASPERDGPYALFGFVAYAARARRDMGEVELLSRVRQQLLRLFGDAAPAPAKLVLKDWSSDPFTATHDDQQPPQGHPTYGLPAAAQGLWDGRLLFAGTEAAVEQGGYLEGALEAADNALQRLLGQ